MERLGNIWRDFPQGRPARPFFILKWPKVIRIRKIPRLSEAKPVASSNPAQAHAPPVYDRPGPRPPVPPLGNDDPEFQRELGYMLATEALPIGLELVADAARSGYDFLKGLASNLTSRTVPVAPQAPPGAVVAPPGPS